MPHRLNRPNLWTSIIALLLAGQSMALAQSFKDRFSSRNTITLPSTTISGNNTGASTEKDEPRHGENSGRHSVWISWIAPENGIATLTVASQEFDTLVAVYINEEEEEHEDELEHLKRIANDDDSGPDGSTQLQFGTRAGHRYEIAVDSHGWQTGQFSCSFDLTPTTTAVPIVLNTPPSLSLKLGDTLNLSVTVEDTGEHLEFHWYHNGIKLEDQESPSLLIPNIQETDIGQYRARVEINEVKVWSAPIEVQINSEGLSNVLARDKVVDALSNGIDQNSTATAITPSSSSPLRPMGPITGVVRGYQGTQMFNTSIGTRDPLEPSQCNNTQGPTYWFAYQPPETGIASLSTEGSSFPTTLTIYSYIPPLLSYDDLQLVACGEPAGTNPNDNSVRFAADPSHFYCAVVGGVNGSTGIAHLNYLLDTNTTPPNTPPILGAPPPSRRVSPGSDILLQASALGSEPISITWFKNNHPIPGATNRTLHIPAIQATDAGQYYATVSNAFGSTTTPPAQLAVTPPPQLQVHLNPYQTVITFTPNPGTTYTLETTSDPAATGWTPIEHTSPTNPNPIQLTAPRPSGSDAAFYRVTAK